MAPHTIIRVVATVDGPGGQRESGGSWDLTVAAREDGAPCLNALSVLALEHGGRAEGLVRSLSLHWQGRLIAHYRPLVGMAIYVLPPSAIRRRSAA